MKLCHQCGIQNSDDTVNCSQCNALLGPLEKESSCNKSSTEETSYYTVPFTISVSDAHSILFKWFEKMEGEHYNREHFHITRMNKKYYGCWLFWFLSPQRQEKTQDTQASVSMEKTKKIIVVPGGDSVPQEVLAITSQYDFMDLCILDNKISQSPEFIPVSISENIAYNEAIKQLKIEEPNLVDDNNRLIPEVQLTHKIPVGLPVWEGSYDYRGGKECSFFINGQKGNIEGEEFPKEKLQFSFKIVTFIVACILSLILLFVIISIFFKSGQREEKTPQTSSSPSSSTVAEYSLTPTLSSPFLSPILSPLPTISFSSLATPVTTHTTVNTSTEEDSDYQRSLKAVIDNFKAIDGKDYEKVYSLRTSRVRETRDKAYYQSIYANNISIKLLNAKVEYVKNDEARINVLINSVDNLKGEKQQADWSGWFLLKKENNEWLIDDSSLSIITDSIENTKEQY